MIKGVTNIDILPAQSEMCVRVMSPSIHKWHVNADTGE